MTQTDKEKIEEVVRMINDLLESYFVKRVQLTPEVSLQDVLEKLKETLEK